MNSEQQRFQEPTTEADAQNEQDAGLNLRNVLLVVRRRKALIATVTVLGLVFATFVVSNITPMFTATADVMIQTEGPSVVDFQAVAAGVGTDSVAVASQVQILMSRKLIEKLIEEAGLLEDPEFNPWRRERRPGLLSQLLGMLPESWGQALGLASPVAEPRDAADQLALEMGTVADAVLARLQVLPVRSTYVIELSFTSVDPAKAARIVNQLANLYIVDQLEAKFEATEQANAWLSTRLEDLRAQVVEAEGLVSTYRINANLGSENSQSLIEQQLTQANAQLTLAASDRAAAEARYQQVQALLQQQGSNSVAEVLSSPLIQSLREREAEAKRTLAELSTRYGERHPDIINAKAEIADLQATISGEVEKIIQNLANEVAVARARERSIEQTVNQLNERFNTERGDTVRLRELEREADATRQLYDTMLARFKETSEQENIQQPDARLISDAVEPRSPSRPKKDVIILAAGIFSFVLGVGLAFLLEQLNRGFRSLDQARQFLGMPGLVEVPLVRGGRPKLPQDLVMAAPTSAYAEAIRSTQTALALANVDDPPRVVAIVSSVPEEGKSALSASLARLAAQGGRRVVLVDCDLRRPQHHRMLGARRSPGLTEVLAGTATLDEVLIADDKSPIQVVTSGGEVPSPHDILQSQRMKALIADLRGRYDLVILDTPAILAVADGLIVANMADAALMVVRWEKTPREVAATAVRSLRSVGTKLMGLALSQVDQKVQARYGYSSYGYYYGRYKSYYSK